MQQTLNHIESIAKRAVQKVYPYLPERYRRNADKWVCHFNAMGDVALLLSSGMKGQSATETYARAAGAGVGLVVNVIEGQRKERINRHVLGAAMITTGLSYMVAGYASRRYGEIANGGVLAVSGGVLALHPRDAGAWRWSNIIGATGVLPGLYHVGEASGQGDPYIAAAGVLFTCSGISGMVHAEAIERGEASKPSETDEKLEPQTRA